MNKLPIIESIFGNNCFTPCVRVSGDKEYYSAKTKLHYFNDWSATSVEWFVTCAEKQGVRVGVDFDRKEFILTWQA